jgi:hypothetical protein
MRGIVPARIPVHKTRKVELKSHIRELLLESYQNKEGHVSLAMKQAIKNTLQTPDLESFYAANNEVVQA